MVARITNDTSQYYHYLQALVPPPPPDDDDGNSFDDSFEASIPEAWRNMACPPPIIAKAKHVLQQRLTIVGDDDFLLDGLPADIKEVVTAANDHVRKMGGKYLTYPGLRPRYDDGLGMNIALQLNDLPTSPTIH